VAQQGGNRTSRFDADMPCARLIDLGKLCLRNLVQASKLPPFAGGNHHAHFSIHFFDPRFPVECAVGNPNSYNLNDKRHSAGIHITTLGYYTVQADIYQ